VNLTDIDPFEPPSSAIPRSDFIRGVDFDWGTLRADGLGSDNWAITWADDDHQYVSWGDGVGFGAKDWREQSGPQRVGFGFGRVEGGPRDYTLANVSGGKDAEHPPDSVFDGKGFGNARGNGKCYGLLSVGGVLYAWRIGDGHPQHTAFSELYLSDDHGASWWSGGVRFSREEFRNHRGFFAPTFCQFGRDGAGARDDYVYIYAPDVCVDEGWEVQIPGRITLMRVDRRHLERRDHYEFYAGLDTSGAPVWDRDIENRAPAFEDRGRGVMRTSVSWNPGLRRYLLATQQVSRWRIRNGHLGLYESPEPWGPWKEVLCENAWTLGLQKGYKNVFYNFSPKWWTDDGRGFVLVYTGPTHDNFGTIEGRFLV
jgi:hypothetical protein